MADAESLSLVELPDPCLQRVLECLAADDQRGLFSAARSSRKLHQVAVTVLRSITAQVSQQHQMDDAMKYLGEYGEHVDRLELIGVQVNPGPSVSLSQVPPELQLSSLQLQGLCLQLQPGNGFQGVLGAATTNAAFKQLRLNRCKVLDSEPITALAAALSQLPSGLEHLSIQNLDNEWGERVQFPVGALQQLQHPTYLELGSVDIVGPVEQPLKSLTRLVSLKLDSLLDVVVTSSMLSGMQLLTRLELSPDCLMETEVELEAGALAGKTQLQHLFLSCDIHGGAAGVAQLLSNLQPMQQLTYLNLHHSLLEGEDSTPPAAAYAALTASSKLQHLDISECILPAGVWQHVFPTGRQLPHLQLLDVVCVREPSGDAATAPEGSRLVSCCPSLQSLHMGSLQCSGTLLAPLQGLSGLQTLQCEWGDATAGVVQAVSQLTRLRALIGFGSVRMDEGSLLQLTQLKQLTSLRYFGRGGRAGDILMSRDNGPVWLQLLHLHLFYLAYLPPGVAQQVLAALTEQQ